MLNSIFILANLLICPHRTCGTVVSRILVRGSTNYIKNNIKDTHNNRNSNRKRKRIKVRKALILLLPPQLSLEAAIIVVIPKSIRPTSDLKATAIASASLSTIIVMMTTSAMHSIAIERSCESHCGTHDENSLSDAISIERKKTYNWLC